MSFVTYPATSASGGADGWLSTSLIAFSTTHPTLFSHLTTILPFLFLSFTYVLAAPRFTTIRQKSYVLSCVSAGVMTVCGGWWVKEWLNGSKGLGGVIWMMPHSVVVGDFTSSVAVTWNVGSTTGAFNNDVTNIASQASAQRLRILALLGTRFFKAYLVMDLGVGWCRYRGEIGKLTGWVHHLTYILIMQYLEQTNFSGLFMLASILELPNFHLALGTLFPRLRHDATFLALFFLIRIGFHAYLIGASVLPSNRELMGGSWVPLVLLVMAMPMHVLWFVGGLRGYLKRRQRKRIAAATKQQVQAPAPQHIVTMTSISTSITHESSGDDDDEIALTRTPELVPSSPPPQGPLTADEFSTPSTPGGLTPLLTPQTLLTGPNGLLAGVRDAFPFPDQDQVREGWMRLKAGVGSTRDEYAERVRRTRVWAGEKASDAVAAGIPRLRLPRAVGARRRHRTAAAATGRETESSDTDE